MNKVWLSSPVRALVATATLLAPSARAEESSVVDYLTPHSVAAVSVRLADLAGTRAMEDTPVEVAAAATEDFLGVRLATIDRVTAVVEPPMGMTPQYAVILHSTEPISFDRFRSEILADTTRGELNGRPTLVPPVELAPTLCLIDDHTLVAAPPLVLKRYIKGVDGSESLLAHAMRTGDGERNHLQAAAVLEPLKPLIQFGIMQAKQDKDLPPEAHKFLDGVLLLDRVVASVDLSGERASSLVVYANDAAAADQVENLLAEGFEFWRTEMLQSEEVQQLRNSEEAVVRAWVRYIDRMAVKQADAIYKLREGDDAFVLGRLEPGDSGGSLATIGVIGLLTSLLLPAVQAAREAARRTASTNNLKQIGLGLLNYEAAVGALPAQAICADDGTPLLSWRVAILPYLEQQDLYNKFKLDEPWDSAHNKPLMAEMPVLFLDPSSELSPTNGKTHYLGVLGPQAVFKPDNRGRRIAEIQDGLSRTIVTLQVDDAHAVPWTKPADFDAVARARNPIATIGRLHPEIFLAGFVDGSVQALPRSTAPATLQSFFSVAGHD